MKIIKSTITLVILGVFLITPIAQAHPGRTNSEGCHTCRTKCTEKWNLDYNEYHCHAKKSKVRIKARTEARSSARQ